MKDDRQFINSVYQKRNEKLKQYKKTAVFSVTVLLVLAVMAAATLIPLNQADKGVEHITNESLIIALPNESVESEESEVTTDKPLENLVLLSCPVEIPEEDVKTSPVNNEPSFVIFGDGEWEAGDNGAYYYSRKIKFNNEFKCFLGLEADPLSTYVHNGKPLSELLKRDGTVYLFKDGEHRLFNEFQLSFSKWDAYNGARLIRTKLQEKANNGDKTAAEQLEKYKDADHETLFYALVWSTDKTTEEISELNRQRAEFNKIWEQYEESGKDILKTSYKEEIEKLISEGYDLNYVTVNGTVKLVGALTAEQAEHFNEDERFYFIPVRAIGIHKDKWDLVFPGSDEIIEVPRNFAAEQ